MNISQDENERARIRNRKKFEMDIASNLATAIDNKVFEITKNLLSMNLPLDQIATATGLTREEVEDLKSLSNFHHA